MAVVKKVRPAPAKSVKKKAKDLAPATPAFTLATEKTVPSDVLQDYSILLFGAKKIGKTTLASMFDDAYFLTTEPGTKSLEVFESPINSWPEFKQAIRALRKDKRFRTVVVDTIDLAYRFCDAYVCHKLGIENVADADWGKGWGEARKEFELTIRDLMSLGKGVVLISHSTEKEITRRGGSKYDRIQPTMPNIAREVCEATVDIWAHYDYDDGRRVLTIRGDESLTAGHRLQTRFQWKGRPVEQIDMGTTKEEGYANFLAAFRNKYPIPDAPPPVEAKPVVKKIMKKKDAA